jgi:hypothetical protein
MLTLTAAPQAAGGSEVFQHLVLARIIEPDQPPGLLAGARRGRCRLSGYRTLTRRLPVFATESWRKKIATACAAKAQLGPGQPGVV